MKHLQRLIEIKEAIEQSAALGGHIMSDMVADDLQVLAREMQSDPIGQPDTIKHGDGMWYKCPDSSSVVVTSPLAMFPLGKDYICRMPNGLHLRNGAVDIVYLRGVIDAGGVLYQPVPIEAIVAEFPTTTVANPDGTFTHTIEERPGDRVAEMDRRNDVYNNGREYFSQN